MTCRTARILAFTGFVLAASTGGATASNEYRDVVRDSDGVVVHNSWGNCVRTKWRLDSNACACAPAKALRTAAPEEGYSTHQVGDLTQQDRTVYFVFNKSTLTPGGEERLSSLANRLKNDTHVKEAHIVGYADRIGSEDYNQRLSQRRAETVRNFLVAGGFTNARVTETRWVGKTEPTTHCPSGTRKEQIACLQNDRRVEVEIEYIETKTEIDNDREDQK